MRFPGDDRFDHARIVVIGGIVGTAVARIPVLRAGIGSLITGMQTMPSVLWFPLAYMVFGNTSAAIVPNTATMTTANQ